MNKWSEIVRKNNIFRVNLLKSVAIISAIAIVTLIIVFSIIPLLRTYQLEYKITPDSVSDKTVRINVRINRKAYVGNKSLQFAKGNRVFKNTKCIDNNQKAVVFEDKNGVINIGPILGNANYVDFTYTVSIGASGAYYDDLLTFNGDSVLLFPYFQNEDDTNNTDKYISKVSLKVDVDKSWTSVIPYKNDYGLNNNNMIDIRNPDWAVFYNLGKSCYAFGKLEEIKIKGCSDSATIFIDAISRNNFTKDVETGIINLFAYYDKTFGSKLYSCPIVLIRKDPTIQSKDIINGAVGAKSLSITLNPDSAYFWRTLSHTLYTAYFESKISIRNIHYPPDTWLYKGLATFYENLSMDSLPEVIKGNFGLSSMQGLRDIYSKYLYFRLKEPAVFKISPADEGSALDGQLQFYYYTEAPLVVSQIEFIMSRDSKKGSALLEYLLKHSNDKSIMVGRMVAALIGDKEQVIREYLSGEKIMPFPGPLSSEEEASKVVKVLNDYEQLLSTWIRAFRPDYPTDEIVMLNPEKISDEVIKRNIRFAEDDVEKMVGDYSPTILMLLKQYALRMDVCGEKNIKEPLLKFKLLGDEKNITKWSTFITKMGE